MTKPILIIMCESAIRVQLSEDTRATALTRQGGNKGGRETKKKIILTDFSPSGSRF